MIFIFITLTIFEWLQDKLMKGRSEQEEYVLETALIQFVNWVDCSVRGIPAAPLKRATMAAAGIEEIDTEYWVNRHKEIVAEINGYFEPEGIMNRKQN